MMGHATTMSIDCRIIFLISLPRSGSTLLQHILAGHSLISASAEPWVLLPALLALREDTIEGPHGGHAGQVALTQFLAQLPGGRLEYFRGLRMMADHLYGQHIAKSGKRFFLDKTSRYYQAIPELKETYPDAKIIFLLRNPVAVLSSFMTSMVSDWRGLASKSIATDLTKGYSLLKDGIDLCGKNCTVIQYEQLVSDPVTSVQAICEYLEVDFEPAIIHYKENAGLLPGKLVDPKSIHLHSGPVKQYLDSWKETLDTGQRIQLARGFVESIGKECLGALGYDFLEIMKQLPRCDRPKSYFIDWSTLMKEPKTSRQQRDIELAFATENRQQTGHVRLAKIRLEHRARSLVELILKAVK